MLLEKIRLVNPEWFREPLSKLELTLRIPFIAKHSLILFSTRFGLFWLLASLAMWLIHKNVFLSVFAGFIVWLIIEMFTLRKFYMTTAVPQHLKNISHIKLASENLKEHNSKDLVNLIRESTSLSSRGLVNIGYVGLAAWGWEIIFKMLYPLLVHTDLPYQNLLIGFKNKATDSDQEMWEVAQEKNKHKQKALLENYLAEYGSKVDDVEIAKPTLREQPEVINNLLKIYRDTPSPNSILIKQREKREESVRSVMESLTIPKPMFRALLRLVQENVALREDRRYYHFLGDYYIRMMLIELATRLNLRNNRIFKMSWGEIKSEVNKNL